MKTIKKLIKFTLIGMGLLIVLGAIIALGVDTEEATPATETATEVQSEPVKEEPKKEVAEPKKEEPAKEEPVVEEPKEEPKKEEPKMTVSQQNAIKHAKQYIDYTPFSKSGLIEQLEYEGYSNADATFAVNNIEVDWREQAVKHAKQYLDYTPFSKQGLIDQLIYEGHAPEDATFATSQVGL